MRQIERGSIFRGVIQSFVEKHFPTGVETNRTMTLFDFISTGDVEKSRKRKSTHQRTTKRSISCDSNNSSDDSDIDCYSSFVPANKRRATNKRRDQNNNKQNKNMFADLHTSDHENSFESLPIEEDFIHFTSTTNSSLIDQQNRTYAEMLDETETECGLPIKRIPKKEISTTVHNCTQENEKQNSIDMTLTLMIYRI